MGMEFPFRYVSPIASRKFALGKKVDRATADVMTTALVPLFTVSGGRVLITMLLGEVTTVLAAGTTPDFKFQADPTTGTTTDMCATVSIASLEVGSLITITGTPATAAVVGSSGNVPGMLTDGVIVAIGAIGAICDENITGSIKFTLCYIPIDDGAKVVAA